MDFVDGFKHFVSDTVDGAEHVVKGVEDFAGGAVKGVEKVIEAPGQAVEDVLTGHPGKAVEDLALAPLRAVGSFADGAIHGIGELVTGEVDFLKAPVDGLVTEINSMVNPGDSSPQAQAANKAASDAAGTLKNADGARGASQAILNETGDFGTSDDILKAGQPGLDFFHAFFPLYQQAAQYTSGAQNTNLNLATDIDGKYNESKGINLSAFRGDAGHLTDVMTQLQTSDNNLSSAFSGLSGWTGSGADAARRYNGDLLGKISGFLGGGTGGGGGAAQAPAGITAAMTNIQSALKTHAGNVLKLCSQQCGGQSPQDVADNIRRASGNLDISDVGGGDILSGMWDMAKDAFKGGLMGGLIGGIAGAVMGAFDSGSKARDNVINQAKQKLQAFVSEFDAKKSSFDGYVAGIEQQIQQDYQTMLSALKPLTTDPLQGVSDPGAFTGGSSGGGGGGGGSRGGGGGGGMPHGGGAGGGMPVGGMPGGGMPGGGMPGGAPGAGATTPSGFTPPPLTGSGAGGAPPTTQPSAQETLTVQHGSDTLSMTSPDASGAMQMSVQGADGKTHKYEIDFPKGGAGTGTPGATPGGAANVGGPATAGRPGAPAGGSAIPAGAAGGPAGSAGGAAGVQHITPGPDGKAVIHDGNTTITATEGPNGQVKVTVSDGKGDPTTYTLDQHPSTTGTSSTPGLPGAGAPAGGGQPGLAGGAGAPAPGSPLPPTGGAGAVVPPDSTGAAGAGAQSAAPTGGAGAPPDLSGGGHATTASGMTGHDPASILAGHDRSPAPPDHDAHADHDARDDHDSRGDHDARRDHDSHDDRDARGDRDSHGDHDSRGDHDSPGGHHRQGGGGRFGGTTAPGGAGFTPPGAVGASAGQPLTTQTASAGDSGLGAGLGGAVGGGHGGGSSFARGFAGAGSAHDGAGGHDLGGPVSTGHPPTAEPGHAGLAGTDVTPLGPPGGAGLASAPDDPSHGGQQPAGAPMMGGGGGGGGGAQGGDQQRGPSQWRTAGHLFDEDQPGGLFNRVSGTLDDRG